KPSELEIGQKNLSDRAGKQGYASTTGWCAKLDGQMAFGNWPEVLSFQEIAKLEAKALLLDLRSFAKLLEGFWILVFIDSRTALATMKLAGKCWWQKEAYRN
ncbi:19590_t:CDS:2, partial [Racocetra persica]